MKSLTEGVLPDKERIISQTTDITSHGIYLFALIGSWQLAVGSWQLAVGSWQLAVGSWQLAVGSWQLAVGSWQLAVGSWQLAVGSWQLAVGSWQLAVGSWQLAVGSWQLALAVGSWQFWCLSTDFIICGWLGMHSHAGESVAKSQKPRFHTQNGSSYPLI